MREDNVSMNDEDSNGDNRSSDGGFDTDSYDDPSSKIEIVKTDNVGRE